MPPKSAKKEPKILWNACDKCGVKIHHNKLKFHDCGSSIDGIQNEKLTTSSLVCSLPSELESIKDAPATYLQRFVFIPETVSALCNFSMGSNNLLIEAKGKQFVMSSWTIGDKHMDEVFTSSDGKQISFRSS